MNIVNKIKKLVSETNYSISIGYSFSLEQNKDIDNMIKESDAMMYQDKAAYYASKNNN